MMASPSSILSDSVWVGSLYAKDKDCECPRQRGGSEEDNNDDAHTTTASFSS